MTDGMTRPTKKQHQTLEFIQSFIAQNGYSPSYREIMSGCNYTSVATVALHVNNLIKRGHIVKRGKSARSLEIVGSVHKNPQSSTSKSEHVVHHLVSAIDERFTQLEQRAAQELLDEVYVLVGTLKILGHHELARDYAHRIKEITLD